MISMYFRYTSITLALLLVILTIPSNHAYPDASFDIYRAAAARSTDEWVISGTEYVNDTTEVWSGNITVPAGATLVYDNSRISFDPSDGPILINVSEGGTLKLLNNTIFNLQRVTGCLGYFIVVSGHLLIQDSTVVYAGYTTPPNVSGCSDPQAATWNHGPGLTLLSGSAVLLNATIQNSTYGMQVEKALLEISNSTFYNNFYALFLNNAGPVKIENTEFGENYYGIFSIASTDIDLKDCFISSNTIGIFMDRSDFNVTDTTIDRFVSGGVLAYRGSELEITNSIISGKTISDPLGYNLFLENSRLVIGNSLSSDGLWGAYLANCTAEFQNTEFLGNEYTGLYAFSSDISFINSTALDNHYGLLLENSTAYIGHSNITDNVLGVFAIGSSPAIEHNTLTRNEEYAVSGLDRNFELGSGNIFTDSENKTNGKGILRQSFTVYVKVRDQHGYLVPFIDAQVHDISGKLVLEGILYVKSDIFGARVTMDNYLIANDGKKSTPLPYNMTLRWGAPEWGGYITTYEQISGASSSPIHISTSIELPDMYVNGMEISLSKNIISEGDTVTVTVPVHTTGSLSPTSTNVSLYINDKFAETRFIKTFNGSQTYTAEFTVKVEKDVFSDLFRVRAEIENRAFEQNYYLHPYNQNNTASAAFPIEFDEESENDSFMVRFMFFILAIFVFLIVVVLVFKYLMAASSMGSGGEEGDESSGDEEMDGPGTDYRDADHRKKIEPPEMVRKL